MHSLCDMLVMKTSSWQSFDHFSVMIYSVSFASVKQLRLLSDVQC